MGPVPGLEVAPESFQVDSREVSTDTFPQPPLSLSCAGAARLAELILEMFSSDPPGEEKKETEGRMEEEEEEEEVEGGLTLISITHSCCVGEYKPCNCRTEHCEEFDF